MWQWWIARPSFIAVWSWNHSQGSALPKKNALLDGVNEEGKEIVLYVTSEGSGVWWSMWLFFILSQRCETEFQPKHISGWLQGSRSRLLLRALETNILTRCKRNGARAGWWFSLITKSAIKLQLLSLSWTAEEINLEFWYRKSLWVIKRTKPVSRSFRFINIIIIHLFIYYLFFYYYTSVSMSSLKLQPSFLYKVSSAKHQ